jgi:signal peptidase I
MSTPAPPALQHTPDTTVRRLARAILVAAVRGRRERGGDWGEAVLAEFAETSGGWEAVRWAAGGLRAVWHERRRRMQQLPKTIRVSLRAVFIVAIFAVAAVAVQRYVLSGSYVDSGSMEPTLLIGDRYVVDKVGFRVTGLHRGDVVVVANPGHGPQPAHLVKRIIGLPGDTIACDDGKVLLNGSPLDEPYLSADADESRTECATVTVPPGRLYLLGDHRLVSLDSRQIGPVRQDTVEGRMLTRVWPIRG